MKSGWIVSLLLMVCLSQAQQIPFTIQKSPVFKDEYKQAVVVLAEKDSEGGMLFARYYESGGITPGDGLYIEKYGADLKLKKEFEFSTEHPNSQKYNMIVGIFASENIIHVIEMYYDLDAKSVICRSNEITADFTVSKKELFRLTVAELQDLGSFSLQQIFFDRSKEMWTNSNSGEIISETDLSKSMDTFPRINSNITMVVNESKTAFAIALDIKQTKSKQLKMYLFDNQLQPKIASDLKRDRKDDKYIFENLQVSDDGNAIYVLGKSYEETLRKKKDGGKYVFELVKVTANSQKILPIDPQSHYIGYLRPFVHGDEIVCLGFFSDFDDKNYTGICHFKTDAELSTLSNSQFNSFTKQFMLDKYGEKKEYKALVNLAIRNVVFTPNHDLVVNAEEESVWTRSSGVGVGVGTKTKLTYEYNDIICAKLNSNGQLLWARDINKDQTRSDEDSFFISYTAQFKNDSAYFFINAETEAKKLKDGRIEFDQVNKDKSNLTVIRINPNGEYNYQQILNEAENPIPFMVAKGIITGEAAYFFGRSGREKQLLKVTLN